jgi:hypothetical protein
VVLFVAFDVADIVQDGGGGEDVAGRTTRDRNVMLNEVKHLLGPIRLRFGDRRSLSMLPKAVQPHPRNLIEEAKGQSLILERVALFEVVPAGQGEDGVA